MAQDPAGQAMLVGGLTMLGAWLAVAAGTVWLIVRRADPPVSLAWLWLGGPVTVAGGVVLAMIFYQIVAPYFDRGE